MALPVESKVTEVAASVPALVASVAVCPLAAVYRLEQGLEVSAQAVTVTVVGKQAMPVLGRESS